MSADNGIYILKTKDQFRVKECSAIDNLYWSFLNNTDNHMPIPTRIIEYFGHCKYTRDENKARDIAFKMERKASILEYGINTISINKTWSEIIKEAKEYAKLEVEVIKNSKNNNWKYELECLERIIDM